VGGGGKLYLSVYNVIVLSKRQSGWLSKRQGASFEQTCELAAKSQGLIPLIIEDGAKKIGPGGKTIISVPNLFDAILVDTLSPKVLFLDFKVRDREDLTPSCFLVRESHRIQRKKSSTERQLETMLQIATKTPHTTGFIVLLKPIARSVFVSALDISNAPKGSKIPMTFLGPTFTPNFRILLDSQNPKL
jgi:hypothetical protein